MIAIVVAHEFIYLGRRKLTGYAVGSGPAMNPEDT